MNNIEIVEVDPVKKYASRGTMVELAPAQLIEQNQSEEFYKAQPLDSNTTGDQFLDNYLKLNAQKFDKMSDQQVIEYMKSDPMMKAKIQRE